MTAPSNAYDGAVHDLAPDSDVEDVEDVEVVDQDRRVGEDDETPPSVEDAVGWEADPADAADQRRSIGWGEEHDAPA